MPSSQLPAFAGPLRQFAFDAGIAGADVRYVVGERQMVPLDTQPQFASSPARQQLPTLDLPFLAGRISWRSNLRIRDIERLPGATAKLQLIVRGGQARVSRDLRARAVGRRTIVDPMIGIPEVWSRDMREGSWLIEDYIDGKTAAPFDITDLVTNHAPAMWLSSARLRWIKRPLQRPLIEVLDRSLGRLFPPVPEGAMWPVCFGHNDLLADNVLRDGVGKFWLVDWELAGVVPLVADLGSAYLKSPQLAGPIIAILAAADPAGKALPPRHQLALGASLALHRWVSNRDFTQAEAKANGLAEGDAIKRFDATTNEYRRSIARLASGQFAA